MRGFLGAILLALSFASNASAEPTLQRPIVPPPVLPTPPVALPVPALCNGQVTSVVEAGRTGGDGTAARPFGSFNEALTAGQRACFLTIEAGPGDYRESLVIRGSHVKLKNRGPTRPVLRGSIEHRSGGWLELNSIDVVGAHQVGIRQVGGRLTVLNVRVNDTVIDPKNAATGIGLWVAGGGQAIVQLSLFERNAHSAIRVEGEGTKAWLTGVVVRNTSVHPLVLAHLGDNGADVGAVLISRQASAWANGMIIEDSAIAGVNVSRSARLRIEGSSINRTTGLGSTGGFAANSRAGATLEWLRTTVTDTALCGIMVESAGATLTGGFITQAPVGACLTDPRMPVECLQKAQFREVGVPLQADHYSVPSIGLGGTPTPPTCPHVDLETAPGW